MTEIILTLVIVALLFLIGWQDWNNRKERKAMLNALKAKDATELANLDIADKTKVKVDNVQPTRPDLTPVDELDDDEFKKYITDPANG